MSYNIARGVIMVVNHLSRLLGEKRMRAATINELYHDIARGISFEQLDRICEVLDCDISQLFEYIPNTMKTTGKSLLLEEHGNRKKHH